jgi:hypothetical protein
VKKAAAGAEYWKFYGKGGDLMVGNICVIQCDKFSAIDREGIRVSDSEVDALLANIQPTGSSVHDTREDVRRTIAFGKLEGRVAALDGQVSRRLCETLGRESRSALRDLLYLNWLEHERESSRIDICLYRNLG